MTVKAQAAMYRAKRLQQLKTYTVVGALSLKK